MGWVVRGSNPGRAKILRPGLEPTILLFKGCRPSFRLVKRSGREVDHSPPTGVKVKNGWSCAYVPPYTLWHGRVTVCSLLDAISRYKFSTPFVLLIPSSSSSDMMVVIGQQLSEQIVCAVHFKNFTPSFCYVLVGPNVDFKNARGCCYWKLGKRSMTYVVSGFQRCYRCEAFPLFCLRKTEHRCHVYSLCFNQTATKVRLKWTPVEM